MKTLLLRSGALFACAGFLSGAYASEAAILPAIAEAPARVAQQPAEKARDSAIAVTAEHQELKSKVLNLVDAYVDQYIAKVRARDKAIEAEFNAQIEQAEAILSDPRASEQKKSRAACQLELLKPSALEPRSDKIKRMGEEYYTHGLKDLIQFLEAGVNDLTHPKKGTYPWMHFLKITVPLPSDAALKNEKKYILDYIKTAQDDYNAGSIALSLFQFERLVLYYPDDKSRLAAYWLYHINYRLENLSTRAEIESANAASAGACFTVHDLHYETDPVKVVNLANETMLAKALPDDAPVTPESKRRYFLVHHLNNVRPSFKDLETYQKDCALALEWYKLEKERLWAEFKP